MIERDTSISVTGSPVPKSVRRWLPARFAGRDLTLIIICTVITVLFLSKALQFSLIGNLQILTMWMATIGIVAVGQTLVIITGGIDLSVGSMVALSGVITAFLATHGWNGWLAVGAALAAAAAIGWLHGILVSKFSLAPFVVTFGSLSLLRGLAQVISGAAPINISSNDFQWLWVNVFGIIPLPAILMFAIFILTAFLLSHSRLGRYSYAVGSNETVARLSGINVDRTRIMIYAISALLAGLAGILMMARIEGGIYTNGEDYELVTIAAVIIGGTSLRGGVGGVWGTLVGVFLMSMINNGLILFNAPPLWRDVITGGIIIGAALLDRQRRKLQEGSLASMVSVPSISVPLSIMSINSATTLDQALSRYMQTIKDRFNVSDTRVYLLNPENHELTDTAKPPTTPGTLIQQAADQVKPIALPDTRNVNRDAPDTINLMHSDIRSALVVPICRAQRVIGVLEIQSVQANAFADATIRALMSVSAQAAYALEANWLLESGWLAQQVRESLRNIHDVKYLDQSALGDWLPLGSTDRGEALRQTLLDAIESLYPNQADAQSRTARRYNIVRQTYIDQKSVDGIIHDLGLSRRQYFYDLKEAVDAIAHYVFAQLQHLAPTTLGDGERRG